MAFLALLLALAAAAGAAPSGRVVPEGFWGGNAIRLQVDGRGADVELGCAHGRIGEPLALDDAERFELRGTYAPEHGGPTREGEKAAEEPARYSGQVRGETLTLTIAVGEDRAVIGTFTLERGARGRVIKCD